MSSVCYTLRVANNVYKLQSFHLVLVTVNECG